MGQRNPVLMVLELTNQAISDKGFIMGKLFGMYKGKVVNNEDERKIGRLQVYIPTAYGDMDRSTLPWANPGIPYNDPPCAIGTLVWIMFMHGDPKKPVYMGFCPRENV